ncbi:MAG: 30S ribosome-binding factor RbfA [Chloroflexota bacterium]
MSQRIDRVDELLRQEIGRILAKEVQDPHIGFATVTDVETTPDLRHARVWVSVIGGAPERAETLAALERAMGFVRHELGVRLRIRRIPALHVALDDSAERGTRVLRIIEELGQGHDSAGEALADAPRSETLPTPVLRLRREGDAVEDGDGEPTSAGETMPVAGETPPVAGKTPPVARETGPRRPPRRAGGRQPSPRGRRPGPRRGDR